ncbi:pyruvate ferredoxin oxidoreductase [Acetivibrio saccincola]|jgi:pyruvate ferredoxin oxidoreductase alpha subunit|uniref:Pyruvate ferredoxin oxidoreductase n=1 Tax=Acetivibrio saccincola TaxID=1677857 RepID=A0A2S8R7M3_9FIRM|nr:pyruvate ferredoxin oxidoreductase [Acetivibrio saccincola]NLW28019.1 pyruvate ferredoxin oxidoreductase [Acetivibrio saccincola]PQQ65798.1 pyruvate ferredoxin oxidoreductase [Acetivibrio saccincola]
MAIRERLSGNEAVAVAMKQINPDVVAAFPITPSTEIPQYFSNYVADGIVDTEFVAVESEHSAMSACVGAQAAGGRAMTATSANGLALMWEILYVAACSRLPIVMACVNRTMSGPLNIHNDHSDSMGARDSGWIQLYSENNQEAYDNMLMANRIGEHPDVMLPVMVCQDGFITSHAIENIELLEDEKVKEFVGEYNPKLHLLDKDNPISVGPLDLQAYTFEHKRQQAEAMRNAKRVVQEVSEEFYKLTGRKYGLFEEYKTEDAEVVTVILNSTAGTAKYVVDELRKEGKKVGLIKPRLYRPFPVDEIANALSKFKAVAVLDKSDSFNGAGGPLFTDVTSALYAKGVFTPKVVNYIYGLGGRDVRTDDIEFVYNKILEIAATGKVDSVYNYLGVRE